MTKKISTGAAVGIGAAAAAAAAAAAGAYWLYGSPDSLQHRRIAKSWMLKARAEVMDAVSKMQEIDKAAYLAIVDRVMNRYAKLGITSNEMSQMMRDFKSAWEHMQAARAEGTRGASHATNITRRVRKSTTSSAKRSRAKAGAR
jgi:NAD(P)-dependent dehydrogenase (short-subunit alcohol dehydrogenase family)